MTETTIHTGSFLQEFNPETIESVDNVNNEQEENKITGKGKALV